MILKIIYSLCRLGTNCSCKQKYLDLCHLIVKLLFLGSNDETDKSDDKVTGTDILSESSDRNMDVESPSSELESLANQHDEESDSGESMASGKEGMYVVNTEHEAKHDVENEGEVKESKGRTSIEPAEKKLKTDKVLPDGGGRLTDSRPASAASSGGKSSTPGKERGKEK